VHVKAPVQTSFRDVCPAKSYRNLKTAGFLSPLFLGFYFFSESTIKNFDCEYPNFDSETRCKEKTTKNLVCNSYENDSILLQF